jgi:hypothetical protein
VQHAVIIYDVVECRTCEPLTKSHCVWLHFLTSLQCPRVGLSVGLSTRCSHRPDGKLLPVRGEAGRQAGSNSSSSSNDSSQCGPDSTARHNKLLSGRIWTRGSQAVMQRAQLFADCVVTVACVFKNGLLCCAPNPISWCCLLTSYVPADREIPILEFCGQWRPA